MSTAVPGSCPVCAKTLRLPADAAGKKVKCSGCATVLRIRGGDGQWSLSPVEGDGTAAHVSPHAAYPASGASQSATRTGSCPGCGKAVVAGDAFCNHCGVDLREARAVPARKAEPAPLDKPRRDRARREAKAERRKKILSASLLLLLLSVLFVVAGTMHGCSAQREAGPARAQLSRFAPEEVLEIDGEETTAAELNRALDFAVALAFGTNYLLGAIMFGLFFWALRSPFPAVLTGLCVYLVVIVLNGVVEPTALMKGLAIKVVAISGLLGGMNAALAERAATSAGGRARRGRPRTS